MTLIVDSRPDEPGTADRPGRGTNWVTRLLLGDGTQPRWVRPAVLALLTATAALYLWGLGSAGWANSYYAAAVQAGIQDLKAWLFGSFDSGNAITVDKPPAALWVMTLSARLFGFSPFTMLLPQALMGVGAVGMLYAAVRRCSGPAAGLIAGSVLALTPVAASMFRYNNPDALLVLLLIVAAYCVVRAIETGSTRWVAVAGCVLGFAFLTKMLQAMLIVPGLGLAFLVAAPVGLWQRIRALLVGAATMVVSAGWYIALVEFWPADSRPYIGGSTDNSLLQLALGYNGIERVVGGEGPGGGGPGPEFGGAKLFFGGDPGVGRLFGLSMGTEASWLLPAALVGLAAGLWFTRTTPRTGRVRASLLLWGGWLLVTGAVFSFMDGIVHPYYTVALAPAVAALVGIAVRELWCGRRFAGPRVVLAAMLAVTGVWAVILLQRNPDWYPALRWIVLAGAIVAAAVMAVGVHRLGRAGAGVVVAGALFGLAGTGAYTVATIAHPGTGPMATSGPAMAGDGPDGGFGLGPGGGAVADDEQLRELLRNTDSRWAAATVGSHVAGDLELTAGAAVMAIGGFSGGDDAPTLTQFQQYVADGEVGYFIASERGGPPGHRGGSGTEITDWVQQNFTATDVGGTTVYDLRSR